MYGWAAGSKIFIPVIMASWLVGVFRSAYYFIIIVRSYFHPRVQVIYGRGWCGQGGIACVLARSPSLPPRLDG